MSEATVTAPDLSALPYELRVRIEVAVTQGAHWDEDGVLWNASGEWPLLHPPLSMLPVSGGRVQTPFLPDYLHDSAAWGALMVRELARWETGEFDGERQHRFWWPTGDDVTLTPGPWTPSIGLSASLAVLAKYGREVRP